MISDLNRENVLHFPSDASPKCVCVCVVFFFFFFSFAVFDGPELENIGLPYCEVLVLISGPQNWKI